MNERSKKTFNYKWLFILPIIAVFLFLYCYYAFVENEVKRQFLSSIVVKYCIIISIILLIILIIYCVYLLIKNRKKIVNLRPGILQSKYLLNNNINNTYNSIQKLLKNKYGLLWKNKVKIIIIFGSKNNIRSLSPDFINETWQENNKTVFLYLEHHQEQIPHEDVINLSQLYGSSIDGIVWITSSDYLIQNISIQNISINIHGLYKKLKRKIPTYIWLVDNKNPEEMFPYPIYCSLPYRKTIDSLQCSLKKMTSILISYGISPFLKDQKNAYPLHFAHTLLNGGEEQLISNFKPFIEGKYPIYLSGIMFSQSLKNKTPYQKNWFKNTNWEMISKDTYYTYPERLGLSIAEKLQVGCLSLILMWGIGSIYSYFVNKHLIFKNSQLAYQAINNRLATAQGLLVQKNLQQEIEHEQFLIKYGTPWYSRFGLNQTSQQLKALWPYYKRANIQLMQTQVIALLHKKLFMFVDNNQKSINTLQTKDAYDILKAYLMMARPEKMDAIFWKPIIFRNWQERSNVTQGIWENTAPSLLNFYAKNFPNHLDWKIAIDAPLVEQARKILLHQIGNHKVEETLYNNITQSISPHFPVIKLQNIVNNTDVNKLFFTEESIPGIYSRQAWEKEVKNAIDQAVQMPRQNIDWVLSDASEQTNNQNDDKALKELLTQHYFNDFQKKWAFFLNSIQWRSSQSINDTIEQLTLFTDVKRSPFIALINTINYEGKTGKQTEDIPGSLIQSTRKLFWNGKDDAINQKESVFYPMEDTFGSLFAIIEGKAGGDGTTNINLQSFLTKVTLLRLKLQQIAKVNDPRAVNDIVFQGKDEELAEINQYSQLMAAFIGDSLGNLGNTLFIKPVEQTKKSVIQPASQNMNNAWKTNIADEWNKAFSNKYPFSPESDNDVSFDLLGQYLRPDTGRLDQFIQSQLGRLMHKEGNIWVVDPLAADGLKFNPQFLQAINQLNQLSEALFVSSDTRFHFELQAVPSPKIIKSVLSIDNQQIIYFNQADDWQLVDWPGDSEIQGASLSVVTYSSKLQNIDEYDDKFGIIHLLDKATITPIDSNIYQLTWNIPNSEDQITYILRNDTGKGILTLLALKNFQFPQQIFEEK